MLPGWSHVSIAGKLAMHFQPQHPLPHGLVFLQGSNDDHPAFLPLLTDELRKRRMPCVMPPGEKSWWLNRLCPEFDDKRTAEDYLLVDVLPWLEAQGKYPRGMLAVAGVGKGGQAAVRFGLRHSSRAPIVASIEGAFDFHECHGLGSPLDQMYASREECRQDTAILQIPANHWPLLWFACSPGSRWWRGNDRLDEKLTALGIPHTSLLEKDCTIEELIAPMLDFITESMQRESLRMM